MVVGENILNNLIEKVQDDEDRISKDDDICFEMSTKDDYPTRKLTATMLSSYFMFQNIPTELVELEQYGDPYNYYVCIPEDMYSEAKEEFRRIESRLSMVQNDTWQKTKKELDDKLDDMRNMKMHVLW